MFKIMTEKLAVDHNIWFENPSRDGDLTIQAASRTPTGDIWVPARLNQPASQQKIVMIETRPNGPTGLMRITSQDSTGNINFKILKIKS